MEPAVKSMSFVLLELGRNQWHNNGNKNYNLTFELVPSGVPQIGTLD
jgi:hypothetical protein